MPPSTNSFESPDNSRTPEFTDVAVERIKLDMLELEVEYIERGDAMTDEEIAARTRELHEQWPHVGDEAQVSGLLSTYEVSADVLAQLTERWGEPKDDGLFLSFQVQDARLISTGIAGFRQVEPDTPSCLQMFYSYLDVDTGAKLVGRPIESTAKFDDLSLEAIDVYLREQCPDVMEAVEEALSPTTRNPTLKLHRLRKVLESLDASGWSDAKVEWLRRYTEASLDFDQEWPYLVRFMGSAVIDEPGFHRKPDFDDPFEFWGKYMGFWLEKTKEGRNLHGSIHFQSPHQSNESIPLASIIRVQSMVQQQSIGEQIKSGRGYDEIPARAHRTTPKATIVEHNGTPPRHEMLAARQRVLDTIQEQAVEAKKTVYETKEEAMQACKVFAVTAMQELYAHNIMGAMLEINGPEVFGMDSQPMSSWSTTEREYLTMGTQIRFENNNFFAKIDPDYIVQGTLVDVWPTYNTRYSDGDELYVIYPQFIIEDPSTEIYTVPGVQPALAELKLTRKISAGLSAGNTIALEEHQRGKRRNQALREFHVSHPDHPATPLFNRLHQALHHLDDDLFLEIDKPEMISSLGELIEQEPDDATVAAILKTSNTLFKNPNEMTLVGDELLEGSYAPTDQVKGILVGIITTPSSDETRQREAWAELEDAANQLHQVRLTSVVSMSL